MKVLIADNSKSCCVSLKDELAPHWDVDTVFDGPEAINAFILALNENQPYDVIFINIELPYSNGLEELKMMRDIEKVMGITPDVKIIMTIAKDSTLEVLDTYYRHGCNYYLIKPVDCHDLIKLVKSFDVS